MFRRWEYNSIESGNECAKSLEANVERIRILGILISSLITAISVSFVGIIGFIGLISPQITRRIIGGDYIFLIPISSIKWNITENDLKIVSNVLKELNLVKFSS